jgi:hypothetical protein
MGRYRTLILDGHGSYLTAEFDRTCTENNIIPVCMPPHSSHLLQPLDVSRFAVIKRKYGQLVEQRMRLGFNHIDPHGLPVRWHIKLRLIGMASQQLD